MKQLYLIIAVTLSMALLTACSSGEPTADNNRKNLGLNPAELIVCEDMGQFNTELFKVLVSRENKENPEDNIIVSPLSASVFLSMHANFSSEKTQEQIFDVLGTADLAALNNFNAKILANIEKLDRTTTLNLANSIWHDHTIIFEQTTKEIFSNYFGAEFFPCDPWNPETKIRINNWIKSKTNNKITDAYDGKPFYKLALNTLYFNSKWKDKFNKSDTKREAFYAGKKIYMVEMMSRTNVEEYLAKGSNFTACRRDFGNGAFTCTFILPDNEDRDINEFISGLSYEDIASIEFSKERCDIFIPKFEITKKYENFEEIFEVLGIDCIDSFPTENIGSTTLKVFHESYINLDEEGAEVAAVTGGVYETISGPQPNKWHFRIDRPFIFMINETSTNACILAGRISKFK